MRRHLLSTVLAAALLGAAAPGHAFISPTPPAGFGGSPGGWTFSPPSGTSQLNGIMRGPGPSINTGAGGILNKPAAYRIGSGAAAAIGRGLYRNPTLIGGAVGLATWLASECLEYSGGSMKLTCGDGLGEVSEGIEFSPAVINPPVWFTTRQAACDQALTFVTANQAHVYIWTGPATFDTSQCFATRRGVGWPPQWNSEVAQTSTLNTRNSSCPAGWYHTDAGCVQTPQPKVVTEEEMAEELADAPLPEVLPPVPIPIDFPPVWNPDEQADPGSMPVRVPLGNPVPVPNTDPQEWKQPAVDIRHQPTTSDPWRMENKPVDVPVTDPESGLDEPVDMPGEGGGGQPPGEPTDQVGLCDQYPDILACQKMGTIEEVPVVNKDVPLELTPSAGFPSGGQCPQPRQAMLGGQSFSFSIQPMCDFATSIRPLIIGMAWFSAALLFLGISRKE